MLKACRPSPIYRPVDVLMICQNPLLALQAMTSVMQIDWYHPRMMYAALGGALDLLKPTSKCLDSLITLVWLVGNSSRACLSAAGGIEIALAEWQRQPSLLPFSSLSCCDLFGHRYRRA